MIRSEFTQTVQSLKRFSAPVDFEIKKEKKNWHRMRYERRSHAPVVNLDSSTDFVASGHDT